MLVFIIPQVATPANITNLRKGEIIKTTPFEMVLIIRDFMKRLKILRKQRRITQLKLAMDLNMNQNTISRFENGIYEADYATLIKLADYFDVSIDYLLERTENPETND